LLWCYPIYWGCRNLQKYLPEKSFSYLDIDGNGDDVIDLVDSDIYKKALPHMKKAREILLDELQLWPRIHQAIFGVNK
jgi:hypothetical protein